MPVVKSSGTRSIFTQGKLDAYRNSTPKNFRVRAGFNV
jgi:hypothetical protein